MVQNSEHFSSLRNGSERNSENFPFRGTAGIPAEQTICSVYSVFRGIIFLSEIANPSSKAFIKERGAEVLKIPSHLKDLLAIRILIAKSTHQLHTVVGNGVMNKFRTCSQYRREIFTITMLFFSKGNGANMKALRY
jgi:hypothetical protein